jgi:hypothetical protein
MGSLSRQWAATLARVFHGLVCELATASDAISGETKGSSGVVTFWRGLFAFAAFYNLAVGGAMLAAPARVAEQLNISGGGAPFAVAMAGLLIAVFGIGYAMVSAAPAKNRGIVWIGLIGKIGAAALAAVQFNAGVIPLNTFLLGMGDLIFVALFALFLWRGPR